VITNIKRNNHSVTTAAHVLAYSYINMALSYTNSLIQTYEIDSPF